MNNQNKRGGWGAYGATAAMSGFQANDQLDQNALIVSTLVTNCIDNLNTLCERFGMDCCQDYNSFGGGKKQKGGGENLILAQLLANNFKDNVFNNPAITAALLTNNQKENGIDIPMAMALGQSSNQINDGTPPDPLVNLMISLIHLEDSTECLLDGFPKEVGKAYAVLGQIRRSGNKNSSNCRKFVTDAFGAAVGGAGVTSLATSANTVAKDGKLPEISNTHLAQTISDCLNNISDAAEKHSNGSEMYGGRRRAKTQCNMKKKKKSSKRH